MLICSTAFAASACKDEVTPPNDDGQDTTSGSDSPATQSASMSVSQFNESFAFVKNCAGNATVHSGLGTKDTGAIDDYLRANGLLA